MTALLLHRTACAAGLALACACLAAHAASPGAESPARVAAAQPAIAADWLPAPASAQAALQALPAVRAATAGMAAAQARADRLRLGPHEWMARAGVAQRRDRGTPGGRYLEQEIGLERTLRWPGKAAADGRLADGALQIGELARADAWHEAARALLADWSEAVREARAAQVLAEQAQLAAQQLAVTRRRAELGEAARMEALAAQAEQARTAAAAEQARARAALLARTLAQRVPQLQPAPDAVAGRLPDPAPPPFTVAEGVERILADNHELELSAATAQLARQQAERAGLERQGDPAVGVRAARERDGNERLLGVLLTVPLGGAGRRADHALALAEADRAEQVHALTVQRVEAEAWRVAQAAHDSVAHWRALESARADTERSAALVARAHALGETPLAELLLARRLAKDAALSAEAARVEALQAGARLALDSHTLWPAPEHAH